MMAELPLCSCSVHRFVLEHSPGAVDPQDSNGKVSYTEFAPLSKVLSTFEQFDTDSNGLISRAELKAVLTRLAELGLYH